MNTDRVHTSKVVLGWVGLKPGKKQNLAVVSTGAGGCPPEHLVSPRNCIPSSYLRNKCFFFFCIFGGSKDVVAAMVLWAGNNFS